MKSLPSPKPSTSRNISIPVAAKSFKRLEAILTGEGFILRPETFHRIYSPCGNYNPSFEIDHYDQQESSRCTGRIVISYPVDLDTRQKYESLKSKLKSEPSITVHDT